MHAYQILRDKEMSVDQVVAVQKQYKEHRCAIDAADGVLKMKARVHQTESQIRMAERTLVRRANTTIRIKKTTQHEQDMRSYFRRVAGFNKKITQDKEGNH
jgi:hypothetical protein